jgi:hypothetical protein
MEMASMAHSAKANLRDVMGDLESSLIGLAMDLPVLQRLMAPRWVARRCREKAAGAERRKERRDLWGRLQAAALRGLLRLGGEQAAMGPLVPSLVHQGKQIALTVVAEGHP